MAKKHPSKPNGKPPAKSSAPTGPAPKPTAPPAVGTSAATGAAPVGPFASIHPGVPKSPLLSARYRVPTDLVTGVKAIEAELNLPVWLLVQDGQDKDAGQDSFNLLGDCVAEAFFSARHGDLKKGQKVALLIDSPGGMARQTYEVAMLLRRHCGGFVAIIPRHAKSAATLLTLGADSIIMNDHAELGPLDVQIFDPDREERLSGLDEVQALERLQHFAMDAMDRTMLMLKMRTKKKARTLLPFVTEFVTKLTKPMFQNIDVVRYTQMSRALKIAEEYAKRLLRRGYGSASDGIAKKLVEYYPEHGFPIYPDEVLELGLKLTPVPAKIKGVLEDVTRTLPGLNVIGRIV